MPNFSHTQEAIDHAQAEMGWTGFDLDDFARRSRPDPPWKGVGIVPASGVHRDSDALARSNASVIIEDFASADIPIDTVRRSHPMVGWSEVTYYDATDAGNKLANHWRDKLDSYPVANEDHYSELEYAELTEYLDSELPYMFNQTHAADSEYLVTADCFTTFRDATIERAYAYVTEDYRSADDLPESAIVSAIAEAMADIRGELYAGWLNPQTENLLTELS